MKKSMSRFVSLVILLMYLLVGMETPIRAEEDDEHEVLSGICGTSVTWTLSDEGVLEIEGEGAIAPAVFSEDEEQTYNISPFEYSSRIKKVVIGEGITHIGKAAFSKCFNLQSVEFPQSLICIGVQAFEGTGLTEVTLNEGLQEIGEAAFRNSRLSGTIMLPESIEVCGEHIFDGTNTTVPHGEHFKVYRDAVLAGRADGKTEQVYCSLCKQVLQPATKIPRIKSIKLKETSSVYDGKEKTIEVTVLDNTLKTIDPKYYTVSSRTIKYPGTYDIWVKFSYPYSYSSWITYTVTKAKSSISLAAKSAEYTGKAIEINKADVIGSTGKVTYTYYTNSSCTKQTTLANSGARDKGKAPVKPGTYYVKAKVASDSIYKSATSAAVKLIITPKKTGTSSKVLPAPKTVTVQNSSRGVMTKWSKVTGAKGYKIYRKTSNTSWKLIASLSGNSSTSYEDTTARIGTKYSYSIKAYNTAGINGKRSISKSGSLEVTVSSIIPITYSQVEISWQPVEKATKYVIYRRRKTTDKWTKISTTNQSSVHFLDYLIPEGRIYYYAVVAYEGTRHTSINGNGTKVIVDTQVQEGGYYEIDKPATCTSRGIRYDGSIDVVIPKLSPTGAHVYTKKEIIRNATCTQDGYYYLKCKYCGQYKKDEFGEKAFVTMPMKAHESNDTIISIQEPEGCIEGYKVLECKNCQELYEETIPAEADHVQGELIQTVTRDCYHEGYTEYQCLTCGSTYKTEYTTKLEHEYQMPEKRIVKCYDAYKDYASCIHCGKKRLITIHGIHCCVENFGANDNYHPLDMPKIYTYCLWCGDEVRTIEDHGEEWVAGESYVDWCNRNDYGYFHYDELEYLW